jgi:hypothetical protein
VIIRQKNAGNCNKNLFNFCPSHDSVHSRFEIGNSQQPEKVAYFKFR